MVEDTGKIISNGYETYKKNFNISIPFVLNVFVTMILGAVLFVGGFLYIFGSSLSSLETASTPEQLMMDLLPLLSQHIIEILAIFLIIVIVISFIQSFFTAGAIGMAKEATETGRSSLSTMTEAGKKNVLNLFLAGILVGLLSIAGMVFMVPGAMKINIADPFSPTNMGPALLLGAGFLIWMIYSMIINLILAVYSYALVVETLGPIEGIAAGLGFFKEHKTPVFILWLIIGGIVIAIAIIGQVMAAIPIVNMIWALVNMVINIFVIPPLVTLWWVRLYMSGTGKNMHADDLLAHPSELSKL